jgi:hypothetical protein
MLLLHLWAFVACYRVNFTSFCGTKGCVWRYVDDTKRVAPEMSKVCYLDIGDR